MKRKLLTALLAVFLSQEAFSLIYGYAHLGKRWFKSDSSAASANYTSVGVFVDPIPLVPIGAGLSIGSSKLNTDDLVGVDTALVSDISLDFLGWLPMVPVITPYAGLRLPAKSMYAIKTKDVNVAGVTIPGIAKTYDLKGHSLRFGFTYKLLPLIYLNVEGETGAYSSDLGKMNANAFKLGVEVGI